MKLVLQKATYHVLQEAYTVLSPHSLHSLGHMATSGGRNLLDDTSTRLVDAAIEF
jgi:hypothetical protein